MSNSTCCSKSGSATEKERKVNCGFYKNKTALIFYNKRKGVGGSFLPMKIIPQNLTENLRMIDIFFFFLLFQ